MAAGLIASRKTKFAVPAVTRTAKEEKEERRKEVWLSPQWAVGDVSEDNTRGIRASFKKVLNCVQFT
jgi:hypothetical protein